VDYLVVQLGSKSFIVFCKNYFSVQAQMDIHQGVSALVGIGGISGTVSFLLKNLPKIFFAPVGVATG
jgi:hypothetical protein